jgi:hypothetical protein
VAEVNDLGYSSFLMQGRPERVEDALLVCGAVKIGHPFHGEG